MPDSKTVVEVIVALARNSNSPNGGRARYRRKPHTPATSESVSPGAPIARLAASRMPLANLALSLLAPWSVEINQALVVSTSSRPMLTHAFTGLAQQPSQSGLIGPIILPLQNYTLLPLQNSARATATGVNVLHYPFETAILRAITPSKLKNFPLVG